MESLNNSISTIELFFFKDSFPLFFSSDSVLSRIKICEVLFVVLQLIHTNT